MCTFIHEYQIKTLFSLYASVPTVSLCTYHHAGVQVSDTSLGALAGLPRLSLLHLEHCLLISDQGLAYLQRE